MSNTNRTRTKQEMSKYCKICHDAGKPDYLTHNIREWNSNTRCQEIVCPYLKNLRCTNCGQKAHTSRYCKEPKQSVVMLPVRAVKPVKPVKVVQVSKVGTNMFELLNSCEEVGEKVSINVKNVGYTLDGECLGTVDDIVWGHGFRNSVVTRWGVNCGF